MTPHDILARPPRILDQRDRQRYFESGYLGIPGLVDAGWLERLNRVTDEFVELSRSITAPDPRFDLEPDHTADAPRIRRLNAPVEHHEAWWEFASEGPFADVAEDLLGPDFKFHHSKLNFKWGRGGEAVKWHQDIQFWPHTNYDVLTLGVYLDDVDDTLAPMGVIPGSHEGDLFNLYDADDVWTGSISDEDVVRLIDVDSAAYITGPAGTVTVHNCRSIHGSQPNHGDRPRPLLLCAYSPADALPLTGLTNGASKSEVMIRGRVARWARFDPRPCLMPPDWSKVRGGYKSIFQHQQREEAASR